MTQNFSFQFNFLLVNCQKLIRNLFIVSSAAEPWYGDYIGEIEDIQKVGLKGYVYVVNDTCLQLIGFTYPGSGSDCKGGIIKVLPPPIFFYSLVGDFSDLYFWLDSKDTLTRKGIKLITFEYGYCHIFLPKMLSSCKFSCCRHKAIGRYENARVVLPLSDGAIITHFSSFGLWCQLTSVKHIYNQYNNYAYICTF